MNLPLTLSFEHINVVKFYKSSHFLSMPCYYFLCNETIEYDMTNEEQSRFFEKIARILIIVKILYPLI